MLCLEPVVFGKLQSAMKKSCNNGAFRRVAIIQSVFLNYWRGLTNHPSNAQSARQAPRFLLDPGTSIGVSIRTQHANVDLFLYSRHFQAQSLACRSSQCNADVFEKTRAISRDNFRSLCCGDRQCILPTSLVWHTQSSTRCWNECCPSSISYSPRRTWSLHMTALDPCRCRSLALIPYMECQILVRLVKIYYNCYYL